MSVTASRSKFPLGAAATTDEEPTHLRVIFVLVGAAVLALLTFGVTREWESVSGHLLEAALWVVVAAAGDLMPVRLWGSVSLSMSLPVTLAAGMVLSPIEAGLVAFVAAFDPREFTRPGHYRSRPVQPKSSSRERCSGFSRVPETPRRCLRVARGSPYRFGSSRRGLARQHPPRTGASHIHDAAVNGRDRSPSVRPVPGPSRGWLRLPWSACCLAWHRLVISGRMGVGGVLDTARACAAGVPTRKES